MSTGLLRGLAARALGVGAPLRSQRARSFGGPAADPATGVEPAPWDTPPQAAAWRQAVVPASPAHGSKGATGALLDDWVAESAAAAPAAVVTPHAKEQTPRREGTHRSAGQLNRDPSPAPPPALVVTADVAPVAAPQPEHHASQGHTRSAETAVRTNRVEIPAALLPLSAPPRLPLPPAASGSMALRRAQATRAAATEAPTEVHVSIGRVELTALAPTANTRTSARREAPAGRSLADYLRGGAGSKSPT